MQDDAIDNVVKIRSLGIRILISKNKVVADNYNETAHKFFTSTMYVENSID